MQKSMLTDMHQAKYKYSCQRIGELEEWIQLFIINKDCMKNISLKKKTTMNGSI